MRLDTALASTFVRALRAMHSYDATGAGLDVLGELGPAEDVDHFVHEVLGDDRHERASVDQVEDRAECAVGGDGGRDEHIGVDHDAMRLRTAHAVVRSARTAASSALASAIASSSEISSPVR